VGEHPFTDDEVEFLRAARTDRGWYLYLPNARSIIDGLVDRGLMAANGAFKMFEAVDPESVNLLGMDLPIAGKMVSYYELIRYGRTAFLELQEPPHA